METLSSRFLKCKNDQKKWEFVLANKDEVEIILENDCTFAKFGDDDDAECFEFDDYVGWAYGLIALFKVIGITAEPC